MSGETVVRTTCKLCISGCGLLVYVKDGKPVGVQGDPDYPINKGQLCEKGKYCLEFLDNPYRLKHPLKRAGKKGEGKWQEISWDEALDTVANELKKYKTMYGAESVLFSRGYAKGYIDLYLTRFANLFGSPNLTNMGCVCFIPKSLAASVTYGWLPYPDYEGSPKCLVLWGVNASANLLGDAVGENAALSSGAKLIVIDPAETDATRKADIWIRPRPCTDLALALGFMHVIINEDLYDKDFVRDWTVGFEELKAHVQKYPPEKVAEITWVPAQTIREVARFYAIHKPACINSGNGLENNINNFQSNRAVMMLKAITGNIGVPGGEIAYAPTGVISKNDTGFSEANAIPQDVRANRLNYRDRLIQGANYTLPQNIVNALIKADPYPIRAAFLMGANLLLSWPNAKETYQALKKLDFMAIMDFFMTPTAELADIVLPVGTFLEIDSMTEAFSAPTVGVTQKVAQVGECKSDYQVFHELAQRLGFGKSFPEEKEFLSRLLKPVGVKFDELRTVGFVSASKQYRIHEKAGFSTPSGKVELYSKKLKDQGFDPLPDYVEPPESPYSEPELAKECPLVLTNRKFMQFTHSSGKQIKSLRAAHPEPVVRINTATAEALSIKDGDWVYIENKRGRIRQKAALSPDVHPRVVIADFGWWFPEKSAAEDLHGAFESNINILTFNKRPYAREMGSPTLRGMVVRVYKE